MAKNKINVVLEQKNSHLRKKKKGKFGSIPHTMHLDRFQMYQRVKLKKWNFKSNKKSARRERAIEFLYNWNGLGKLS